MKRLKLLDLCQNQFPDYTKKELYSFIMCGEVKIAGGIHRNPQELFSVDQTVELVQRRFVSRGGEKLDYALEHWKLSVEGLVVVDAGCSTGGFTDSLLQRGAGHVYSVDVGFNQLDFTLRQNPRITVLEQTNVMSLADLKLDPQPELAVADLSFRSIKGAAAYLLNLISGTDLIALVKPQFELINPDNNFDGIVRSDSILEDVLNQVVGQLKEENSFVKDILCSPILGRKGNREFLFWITSDPSSRCQQIPDLIKSLVQSSST